MVHANWEIKNMHDSKPAYVVAFPDRFLHWLHSAAMMFGENLRTKTHKKVIKDKTLNNSKKKVFSP